MTNMILPRRRKLIASTVAAGLAAASPEPVLAMPARPALILPPSIAAKAESAGHLFGRHDYEFAMFMLAKTSNMLVGGADAAAVLKPQDVFKTSLYTGNGGSQTITTGIDMTVSGGMTWIKSRSDGYDHYLNDTVRGITKTLASNLGDAEVAHSDITSRSSTGFGLTHYWGGQNNSGKTFAAWSFRRAAKFFDIVTWTGDSVAGRTIPHAAGTPGMVLVKCLSNNSTAWDVFHRSLPIRVLDRPYGLKLNSSDYQNGSDALGTATSSNIVIGQDHGYCNSSGRTYVAYVFAHDADPSGIIQCGRLVPGVAVNLGWEPQYLWLKTSDIVGNWFVLDKDRGVNLSIDSYLRLNVNNVETNSFNLVDVTSTGFTADASSFGSYDMVYLAIRAPI